MGAVGSSEQEGTGYAPFATQHKTCDMRHVGMLQVEAEKARADRAEELADQLLKQIKQIEFESFV